MRVDFIVDGLFNMNEKELSRYVNNLVREHDLKDTQIVDTLKVLSVDLDTLRKTKTYIVNLNHEKKDLLKENVLASLRRRDDVGQTATLLINTFIAALVFSFFSILFGNQTFPWTVMSVIFILAVY